MLAVPISTAGLGFVALLAPATPPTVAATATTAASADPDNLERLRMRPSYQPARRAILVEMASTAEERSARRRRRSRSRADDGRQPIPREAWARLAACTAAAALLQLDGTVITVALPTVARDLHVSNSSTALVLSAYFAAYALLLFPGGRLVDRLGARRVALLGLGIFAVGAPLGAAPPSASGEPAPAWPI